MDANGTVPIDREAWSPRSRRSLGHYDASAAEYEGIRCMCRACQRSFVCCADEQREAYEVLRKHVSWLPRRCQMCASKLAELRVLDKAMQGRWDQDREAAHQDETFVKEWLVVIRAMHPLGFFNSMEVHLERLSASAASASDGAACGI